MLSGTIAQVRRRWIVVIAATMIALASITAPIVWDEVAGMSVVTTSYACANQAGSGEC